MLQFSESSWHERNNLCRIKKGYNVCSGRKSYEYGVVRLVLLFALSPVDRLPCWFTQIFIDYTLLQNISILSILQCTLDSTTRVVVVPNGITHTWHTLHHHHHAILVCCMINSPSCILSWKLIPEISITFYDVNLLPKSLIEISWWSQLTTFEAVISGVSGN